MKKISKTLIVAILITVCAVAISISRGRGVSPEDETTTKKTTVTASEPTTLVSESGDDFQLICEVVEAEAGGEPLEGKMAVAQCIKTAMKKYGYSAYEVITKLQYAKARPEPSEESVYAATCVFFHNMNVTPEPIVYFYNPDKVESEWHENQIFVTEIGHHRFFKEAE